MQRYWRNRGRQWLLTRLPDGERAVALAYTRDDRRRDKPGRDLPFQPGAALEAERWEGQIIALTVGDTTLHTIAHPDERARQNAANRRFGTIAAITFAAIALLSQGMPWLTGRLRKSPNKVAVPG